MRIRFGFFVMALAIGGCETTSDTNASSGGSSTSGGGPVSLLPPLCKLPGGPSAPGALCGPPTAPCKGVVDEFVPVPPAFFRADTPALTLDAACNPQIIAVNTNASTGSLALRSPSGEWTVSTPPFVVANVGLTLASAQTTIALVNDGSLGTLTSSHWVYDGTWHHYSEIPMKGYQIGKGFAIGNDNELFAALRDKDSALFLANFQFMQGWKIETLGSAETRAPVVVSPEGSPHLIAWNNPSNGPWELSWYAPPQEREVALLYGSTGMDGDTNLVALAASAKDDANPQGKPHILAFRRSATGHELVYVTRESPNAWTIVPIEETLPEKVLYPLGVVTDEAGNVRLFYSRTSASAPETGELVVAWPDGKSAVSSAVIASGFSPFAATFARDGAGRIHVAMYVQTGMGDTPVRYLVLGP